jgi:hypothetical protein
MRRNNMNARCKFKCINLEENEYGCNVKLDVVSSGSEENKTFFRFTPSGELKIGLVQTDIAHAIFKPGQEYYVDIQPAVQEKEE